MIESTTTSITSRGLVLPGKIRPTSSRRLYRSGTRAHSARPAAILEAYLRRDDTRLSALLATFCSSRGPEYAASRAKRGLDVLIAVTGLLFAVIPLLLL